MIIAVDFDGVLTPEGYWPKIGPPNNKLIQWLITQQQNGAKVILWTCRVGEAVTNAIKFCSNHGLIFDAVNENLPEIIALYGCESRKIFADIYIDDRAYTYKFTT